jgi:uncharacterized membrane protein YfcA
MMCASSGIGGGGIYVSMLILLGNFTPQVAVPLSTVIIFGSSISNFALLGIPTSTWLTIISIPKTSKQSK